MPAFSNKSKKLSDDVCKKILVVAKNPEVQASVLSAMFQGCERGTDLWESLEESAHTFSQEIKTILWDEENGLYTESLPHQVIVYLIDSVEKNVTNIIRSKTND